MPRTVIQLRVTEEEKSSWGDAAKDCQMTISEWLRTHANMVVRGAREERQVPAPQNTSLARLGTGVLAEMARASSLPQPVGKRCSRHKRLGCTARPECEGETQ